MNPLKILTKENLESENLRIQGSMNPNKKDCESFENLNKQESRIQESKDPGIQESKQKSH